MEQQPAKKQSETVVFDVGGKIFKVLREPTLSMCPSSLLSQLAADAEGDEPIFVEADSELFRYLLAFHRHRAIHIPFTVSKEEILREARTLNLPVKPEDVVQEAPQLCVLNEAMIDVHMRELNGIAKSVKASAINLVRDLVLKHVVTEIKGDERVWCSVADVINKAGHSEGLARLDSLELARSLQPWASKHGFQVQVENPSWNLVMVFVPSAHAPNLPVDSERAGQEVPRLCVLNEAMMDMRKRMMDVCKCELEDIAKSMKASKTNLARDLVLQRVVTEIKGQHREVRLSLSDVIKEAGLGHHLARQNVEELAQSLQPWASMHGFQVKRLQPDYSSDPDISFVPIARASS